MIKSFCYHARNVAGQKILGGMIHAESMEEAATKVIKRNKIEVVVQTYTGTEIEWKTYTLLRGSQKIDLYISVHPENLKP